MKKLIKICLIVLVAALATAFAGFAMTGFDTDAFVHFANVTTDADYQLVNETVADSGFNSVVIKTVDEQVVLKPSADDDFHLSYYITTEDSTRVTQTAELSTNDGVLKLEIKNKQKWFTINLTVAVQKPLTVEIPASYLGGIDIVTTNSDITANLANNFNSVRFKTTNGDVTANGFSVVKDFIINSINNGITVSGISCDSFTAATTNGRVSVEDSAVTDKCELRTSNGSITVSSTSCDSFTAATTNGKVSVEDSAVTGKCELRTSNSSITVTDSSFGSLKVHTTDGKIGLSSVTSDKIEADTSNSSIDIAVNGAYESYRTEVRTSNSTIRINGTTHKNGTINPSAPNLLTAKTTNGSITITFTS